MSHPAQKKLIKLALKNQNYVLASYLALRMYADKNNDNEVYLPNAYSEVQGHVEPKTWASILSILAVKGQYKGSKDPRAKGFFGHVIFNDNKEVE